MFFSIKKRNYLRKQKREENHAVVVAALQKAAKFWEYWLTNPENAYRFLSEEEQRVYEICDRMAAAYASK